MRGLQRIDPAEAEEFDDETESLLTRWAARKLDVADASVVKVLVEVTGGCGEGTCEFTTARAEVDLADGRVFLGPNQGFGLFIQDIVEMDVAKDGSERRLSDMWDLYSEDGKKVPPKPSPKPERPAVVTPSAPAPGISIRTTQERADVPGRGSMVTNQRTEVYTGRGWVDLREVVATYDAEHPIFRKE